MSFKINYEEKIVANAFHGTSAENATSIQQHGFKPSKGNNQYLGDGIYFYLNSKWHAEIWASRRRKFDNIAVFEAIIDLGTCLNLGKPEHRKLIKKVFSNLKERGCEDVTDAAAINFFASNICSIDTVMAVYVQPEYGKIDPNSRFYDYVQNLLCVRNGGNIVEYDLVRLDS